MIIHNDPIISFQTRDAIFSVSFSCNSLKEFGVLVSELDPSDGASLFPIFLLVLQEMEQVFFENGAEVAF